jgi:hypothetical protein
MDIEIGKKIRIKNAEYYISDIFTDFTNNEDVLILKKPSKIQKRIIDNIEPSTIYDLGYTSPNEIDYSEEEKVIAAGLIDELLDSKTKIAIVDPSGLIRIEEVVLRGITITDRDLYIIEFKDGVQKMKVDFLLKAFLLSKEYQHALDSYRNKKQPTQDFEYNNILKDQTSSEFENMLSLFDNYFTRRFDDRFKF